MNKVLKIKCRQCDLEFDYYTSKFRPFCSERCKMVDLGHWLTESYTIPSNQPLSDRDLEVVIEHQTKKVLGDNDEEV